MVIVSSSDSTNSSSDLSKGSYDLSNGVTASSSEYGLSGFLKGTMVYSFESEVSETITIPFPFGMMQCILCVLGTASTPSHLASNCGFIWSMSPLAINCRCIFGLRCSAILAILLCCCYVHLPTSNMPPHCSLDCSPKSIHHTFSMRCGEEVPCKL